MLHPNVKQKLNYSEISKAPLDIAKPLVGDYKGLWIFRLN